MVWAGQPLPRLTPWARSGFAALDPDKRGPFLSGFIQQQPEAYAEGLLEHRKAMISGKPYRGVIDNRGT